MCWVLCWTPEAQWSAEPRLLPSSTLWPPKSARLLGMNIMLLRAYGQILGALESFPKQGTFEWLSKGVKVS